MYVHLCVCTQVTKTSVGKGPKGGGVVTGKLHLIDLGVYREDGGVRWRVLGAMGPRTCMMVCQEPVHTRPALEALWEGVGRKA
jgi:hypothetical protein